MMKQGVIGDSLPSMLDQFNFSATIQYYCPSDPPLVPHVDRWEFAIVMAIVIGLRMLLDLSVDQFDESLRWLNPISCTWEVVLMKVDSVVLI